jgi:pyruvate/2-oxoglutarate dehydrogenase complex dihydrolipoamide dehydrogenase (E3) component
LVVIGAGAGGLVTAAHAASNGIKVAMIERSLLGGDCLNTGCVPSKALIKCANVAHEAKVEAAKFGITCEDVQIDFPFIMERMRKIRAQISENDSVERF